MIATEVADSFRFPVLKDKITLHRFDSVFPHCVILRGVVGVRFVNEVFNRQLVKHGFSFWGCCQFFTHPGAVLGIIAGFSPAAFSGPLSGSPYFRCAVGQSQSLALCMYYTILSAKVKDIRQLFLAFFRKTGDADSPVSRDHHNLAASFTGKIV